MPVDLQKVQGAANLARNNFSQAMEISHAPQHAALIRYVNEFMAAPVTRPVEITRCAERSRGEILGFSKGYTSIIEEAGFLTIQQELLVTDAATTSMKLYQDRFLSELDDINRTLLHRNDYKDKSVDVAKFESTIEQIKTDTANFGYAVALFKQRGADLANERLKSLGEFCEEYLHTKTPYQVIRNINSDDIVNILFEFLVAAVEDLALIGPIRKIYEIWDKKRNPKAGVEPGNTDYMFLLDEILTRDTERMESIQSALTDAKAYAEVLRIRLAEVQNS